jgi:hypothetical protein
MKASQECIRVITELYSRFFVNSGTGDPVCQKQGQNTLVLYASVPYTVLLLQDPYYWQQDPSFQRIVFTFHSYFTSATDLLKMLLENYGYETKMEREKQRISAPSSPRDEKKMTKSLSLSLSLSLLHLSLSLSISLSYFHLLGDRRRSV